MKKQSHILSKDRQIPTGRSLALIICTLSLYFQSPSATSNDRAASTNQFPRDTRPQVEPNLPMPGDELGYSKEESIARLSSDDRQFLDQVLKLYKEPGRFYDLKLAFATLGTVPSTRQTFPPSIPRASSTDRFRQCAKPIGAFSRPGWIACYEYWGRNDIKETWYSQLTVEIPFKRYCIDSKAVEGYLGLYLYPRIWGYAHPIPSDRWDRHGVAGIADAKPAAVGGPALGIGFIGGCLSGFTFSRTFNSTEISDAAVLDQ